MMQENAESTNRLEKQIAEWRSYLSRRQAIDSRDMEELEDHLREQVSGLEEAGLSSEEAFLVTVKRMGALDELSREFAAEHSDRLWKQLVVMEPEDREGKRWVSRETIMVFLLAVGAALAIKLPALFGIRIEGDANEAGFYARNVSLFVFPFLAGYFAWKRQLSPRWWGVLGAAFLGGAVLANLYPMEPGGNTEGLTALHLPILLWLVVGLAYAGDRWRQASGRMDFIRYTGELFIYYVLIAFGGMVFSGFMMLLFEAAGVNAEPFFVSWVLPCGAAGALIVASWLVEAKQSVIENMAPVLTRLFTPLFAILLLAFLGTLVWSGRGLDIERNLLIAFDLLMVVVLGLLLYSVSARDPRQPPNPFDWAQVVLLVSALFADLAALWAIAARISEFGFSPNRIAALGENGILLVNLAWSAVLYIRFIAGRGSFTQLERWQTDYLPVYAVWAGTVVCVFPPLFDFI